MSFSFFVVVVLIQAFIKLIFGVFLVLCYEDLLFLNYLLLTLLWDAFRKML